MLISMSIRIVILVLVVIIVAMVVIMQKDNNSHECLIVTLNFAVFQASGGAQGHVRSGGMPREGAGEEGPGK
jgi:uncharacterized membrane protein YqiK